MASSAWRRLSIAGKVLSTATLASADWPRMPAAASPLAWAVTPASPESAVSTSAAISGRQVTTAGAPARYRRVSPIMPGSRARYRSGAAVASSRAASEKIRSSTRARSRSRDSRNRRLASAAARATSRRPSASIRSVTSARRRCCSVSARAWISPASCSAREISRAASPAASRSRVSSSASRLPIRRSG